MKFLITTGLAVALAAAALAAGGAGQTVLSLANERAVLLTVHGLSCPLCSNNLSGRLKKIPGVEDVSIDLETGGVRVDLSPGHDVTQENLQEAVDSAGFTLVKVLPAEGS